MFHKKVAAIIIFTLFAGINGPSASSKESSAAKSFSATNSVSLVDHLVEISKAQTYLKNKLLKNKATVKNTQTMRSSLENLKSHVGKTRYVFSGSTTRGWDCSGLVKWFYQQHGVTLEHKASVQQHSGAPTKTPKPGDIVVFVYEGKASAYHVGIYLGSGKMIHAPSKGKLTSVDSVKSFGGKNSKITYRSLIHTS